MVETSEADYSKAKDLCYRPQMPPEDTQLLGWWKLVLLSWYLPKISPGSQLDLRSDRGGKGMTNTGVKDGSRQSLFGSGHVTFQALHNHWRSNQVISFSGLVEEGMGHCQELSFTSLTCTGITKKPMANGKRNLSSGMHPETTEKSNNNMWKIDPSGQFLYCQEGSNSIRECSRKKACAVLSLAE